jgi:3-deoxy-manno-octulosonate cytidylyltransferase (CMP-KDO synthetase)
LSAVKESGGEAIMTAARHLSGSDRIAEVAAGLPAESIIVNVQGDEPMISPETIDLAVRALAEDESIDVATTCEPIDNVDDVINPNVVKVVTSADGFAIYFSRSPIPYLRAEALAGGGLEAALEQKPELLKLFKKHTGLYVYRREFLLRFAEMPPAKLEQLEMLEQLRALENGARIKVVESNVPSIGVDTQEDLERVALMINNNG